MFQNLANEIGNSIRRAESAAAKEGAKETKAELVNLHLLLGQGFSAANHLGAELNWAEASGHRDGVEAQSGGTPKGPPPKVAMD